MCVCVCVCVIFILKYSFLQSVDKYNIDTPEDDKNHMELTRIQKPSVDQFIDKTVLLWEINTSIRYCTGNALA